MVTGLFVFCKLQLKVSPGLTPVVLDESLNGGAEEFSVDVCGFNGKSQALCLCPHNIIKLISKQRDPQDRNSVVHCLKQTILSSMSDKEARFVMALRL